MLISALVLAAGALIVASLRRSGERQTTVEQAISPSKGATPTATDSSDDLRKKIADDTLATARKNYVDDLREAFQKRGAEASISDISGELTIVSDAFKSAPDRKEFIRGSFGPATRRNLCAIGFKSFAVKSGIVLGDSEAYSLGCRETKQEKEARLQEERSARQKFVDDLQQTFAADPETQDMQVTQHGAEIIVTAESFKSLPRSVIRAMWMSQFDNAARKNLCSIGLRGLRTRPDSNSSGTFIPFNCGVGGQ